jgi:phosphatidyl-myo-inositol alpha-mannosyltransferase
MKVALICPYNLGFPGGVQQHVIEQANELQKRGHSITIITPRPRGRMHPNTIAGCRIIYIGYSTRVRTPQNTSVDVSLKIDPEGVDELFDPELYDIVHCHEPMVPMLSRQIISRVSQPVVGTFHAAIPENIIAKSIAGSIGPYVRSITKHISAMTVVSEPARGYLEKYIDTSNVCIIPNGINSSTHRFTSDSIRDDFILYVGRLEKRKGVEYLLTAYARLISSGVSIRLVIAGDGPEKNKLQKMAKQLDIEGMVTFPGFVDDAKKCELMSTCKLFVSPAIYGESFGIVLLEALASGCVIVASDNEGYASVLDGSGSICLVDVTKQSLFAQRMNTLLTDQVLRKMVRSWGKKTVKRYSYNTIVDKYEHLYQKLLDSRAS